MFFSAVLHSFSVCGDRDLETPSDGNFHLIRRSRAFPHPFPPGFHWDGTNVYVFIQPLSFLDLWGCVNFYFDPFWGEFPILEEKCCSRCIGGVLCSVPSPSWGGRASPLSPGGMRWHPVGCFGLVFTCQH